MKKVLAEAPISITWAFSAPHVIFIFIFFWSTRVDLQKFRSIKVVFAKIEPAKVRFAKVSGPHYKGCTTELWLAKIVMPYFAALPFGHLFADRQRVFGRRLGVPVPDRRFQALNGVFDGTKLFYIKNYIDNKL